MLSSRGWSREWWQRQQAMYMYVDEGWVGRGRLTLAGVAHLRQRVPEWLAGVVRESESMSQLASINLLPGRIFCGVPPNNLIAYAVYTTTWPAHTHKCEWLPCQHTAMPTYRHGSSWTSLRPLSFWTEAAPPNSLWVSPGASGGGRGR